MVAQESRYLGRSPHEAFFTPDGKEIYAAVRGEDYVAVLDADTLDEITRIKTNSGPAMVLFRPDGKYAFVPSSFTPELCVIDCASHEVVARVPQASPFSPNLAVSADGRQVWFTLKDSGQTQVMDAAPPFAILGTVASGPITNHVTTVDNASGPFRLRHRGQPRHGEGLPARTALRAGCPRSPTGALPHGIWGSPDGTRVYIGLENEASVQGHRHGDKTKSSPRFPAVSCRRRSSTCPMPPPTRKRTARPTLLPLATLKESKTYQLRPQDSTNPGRASVTVISLGLIDQVQIAASGLTPGQEYTLQSDRFRLRAARPREPLARMKASPAGTLIANTPRAGARSPPSDQEKPAPVAFALESADEKAAPALLPQ